MLFRFVRRACCSRRAGLRWCHIVLGAVDCVLELAFSHLALVLASLSVLPWSRPPGSQAELFVLGLNRPPVYVVFELASWDAGRAVGQGQFLLLCSGGLDRNKDEALT